MAAATDETLIILEKLVSFETVSRRSNIELIRYIQSLLIAADIKSQLVYSDDKTRANLYASVGPMDRGGVMLSGHSDVVPVAGQAWSFDPFSMMKQDGKLYGRGTTDMKGFVASAVNAMIVASQHELKTPLHLAISYDEEIGCIGVKKLISVLRDAPQQPIFCIVGEPTEMKIASGHKGKIAMRASFFGKDGHSALAPFALNAIHLACDAVQFLRKKQSELSQTGAKDEDYIVPYSTIHTGLINGGTQLNIVPNKASIDFEIRAIASDDIDAIVEEIGLGFSDIVKESKDSFSEAGFELETLISYPGLDTPAEAEIISFMKSLTGANDTIKVAYGTEGGLFSKNLSLPTIACGPGSMDQGHKPDEFIEISQLEACDLMMSKLIAHLAQNRL